MNNKPITLWDVRRHIRKCKKKGVRYNWLGFVENRDLTPVVEALFTLPNPRGYPAYDWVNGNAALKHLESEVSE